MTLCSNLVTSAGLLSALFQRSQKRVSSSIWHASFTFWTCESIFWTACKWIWVSHCMRWCPLPTACFLRTGSSLPNISQSFWETWTRHVYSVSSNSFKRANKRNKNFWIIDQFFETNQTWNYIERHAYDPFEFGMKQTQAFEPSEILAAPRSLEGRPLTAWGFASSHKARLLRSFNQWLRPVEAPLSWDFHK